MSRHPSPMITVTLRRMQSGYKYMAFQTDDINQGYSMALVLLRSQEYGFCYAVGTDWQGNQVFVAQPPQAAPPAPYQVQQQPQYQQQQLPQYQQQAYQALPQNTYQEPQQVYAEVYPAEQTYEQPYYPALPPYGRR